MRIQKVTVKDAKELIDIYAPYVRDTAISFEYEVPTVTEFEERIKKISSKYPYLKVTDDSGKILGYAYAGAFKERAAYDWAVETTIYIKEGYHKKGIGKYLYEALEEELKAMGVLNLNACIAYTQCEDRYLTNASMHFHESLGYKLVGIFHKCGYKFNTWYDMIWMEKLIGEHRVVQPSVSFGKKTRGGNDD